MSWDLVSHPPDRGAVEPRERDREPGPELLLELGQHGPGRDHEDPVRPAAQSELRGNQARLQGLPEAYVIRDQKAYTILGQRPLDRQVLERQIVNRGPAQRQRATRRCRCRPERGCEMQLRVEQPGGRVRDEPDRSGVKDARTLLEVPDEPGLLVPNQTIQAPTVDLPEAALQRRGAKDLPGGGAEADDGPGLWSIDHPNTPSNLL